MVVLEVCVDSAGSVAGAVEGGAERLELCSSLALGGLTPTVGLLRLAKSLGPSVPAFCMLRPREGNFVYSAGEAEEVLGDAAALREAGADGFVFGALDGEGRLDEGLCRRVREATRPLPLTLHRAVDVTPHWEDVLHSAVRLGFHRVLTSGGEATALGGKKRLRAMQAKWGSQLVVMAGSGVSPEGVAELVAFTGVREVHASASATQPSPNPLPHPPMGPSDTPTLRVTCPRKVAQIKAALSS